MAIWHRLITHHIEQQVSNPDIAALLRRWLEIRDLSPSPSRASVSAAGSPARRAGIGLDLPDAARMGVFDFDSWAPELKHHLMLLSEEPSPNEDGKSQQDFRYVRYGSEIAKHAQFNMTGRVVSSFGGEIGSFFQATYQRCLQEGRPHYTVHYADRARNVFTWERLILPLAAAGGGRWLLVYNRPLQNRLELQEQVLDASDEAFLALQAIRNEQGEVVDWLVLMLNRAMANLVGVSHERAAGQAASAVLLRWQEMELATTCKALVNREPGSLPDRQERELHLVVAGASRGFLVRIRRLQDVPGARATGPLADACVLRFSGLEERRAHAHALEQARRRQQAAERENLQWAAGIEAELQRAMSEPPLVATADGPLRAALLQVLQGMKERREAASAGARGLHATDTRSPPASHQPGEDVPKAMAATAAPSSALPAASVRVLVVEDDAVNQFVLRRQLELLGCRVELAQDGRDALQQWRAAGHDDNSSDTRFDLVLSDLHMPVMDGLAFARELRQQENRLMLPRVPLLAITGDVEDNGHHGLLDAGMDDVLRKPVQLAELREALKRWLVPERHDESSSSLIDAGAELPVLNLAVLRDLLAGDEASVHELLADYHRSAQHLALELRQAFRNGDAPQLAAVAHKLKSASQAVGASTLAALCGQMERRQLLSDRDALAAGLEHFDRALSAVLALADEHLHSSKP